MYSRYNDVKCVSDEIKCRSDDIQTRPNDNTCDSDDIMCNLCDMKHHSDEFTDILTAFNVISIASSIILTTLSTIMIRWSSS